MDFKVIDKIDLSRPTVIFARHAERYDIESLNNHHEVLLTEKGISDSYDFGKHISGRSDDMRIYHSTVARCRQTAESIINGITDNGGKSEYKGEFLWLLGDYMFDKVFIDKFINTYNVNTFLRTWFDGKFPHDIVSPIDRISNDFLICIKSQLENFEGLTIDISHDWNISIMLEYYMGLKHESIGIPVFLDHIVFQKEEKNIKMIYHEYETDL